MPPVSVSRETRARLDTYLALLQKWQAKINLVAPDTLKDAETRHIQDSLQLLPLLPSSTVIPRLVRGISDGPDEPGHDDEEGRYDRLVLVDFGSGAGFPGLALALARPDIAVHLVESDARKCEFMRAVSRETKTPVTLHTTRIEALTPFWADVITARALAPLVDLLRLAGPFVAVNPLIRLIFLKGEKWESEVAAARQTYDFTVQDIPSITHPQARVLVITGLSPKD